jgi:hypothetical protein
LVTVVRQLSLVVNLFFQLLPQQEEEAVGVILLRTMEVQVGEEDGVQPQQEQEPLDKEMTVERVLQMLVQGVEEQVLLEQMLQQTLRVMEEMVLQVQFQVHQ